MRKLLYSLLVFSVLAFSLVPVSALTDGTTAYYSPVSFDSFRTGVNYSVEDAWGFNILSDWRDSALYPGYFAYPSLGPYDSSSGSVNADIELEFGFTSFQLRGSDQVVSLSQLQYLKFGFGLDLDQTGIVSYSCNLWTVGRSGSEYVIDYITLTGYCDSVSGIAYIGERMVEDISYFVSTDLVYISNLVLTVEYLGDTVDGVVVSFMSHYYSSPQQSVSSWFNMQDLVIKEIIATDPGADNFDPVSFLDRCLDGLFAFELIPGLTIGGLIIVPLAICVLILFLKLTGRG